MYLLILHKKEAERPSMVDTLVAWLQVFGSRKSYGDELELSDN
jgi:hypothetical protein